MNPVFRGDLVNIRSGTSIRLPLPAEPYKILDGMECVHCGSPSNLRYEIGMYEKAGYLSGILDDAAEGEDIQRLNCLASRLKELDSLQETAFCGMAEKETQSQRKISLEQLVDLSYSTEGCHVLPEVRSDSQLGEFLVDNGFIADVEDIPQEIRKYLDYEKIGREHREAEGGILTKSGYVERWDEIHRIGEETDFRFTKPEYTILLETKEGRISLPMDEYELEPYLWREIGEYRCADCAVPFFEGVLDRANADLTELNRFAGMLGELEEQGQLRTFKAVLQATHCRDMGQAMELGKNIEEEYVLFQELADPADIAREWLSEQYPDDIELFSDEELSRIGERYMAKYPAYETDYGYLQRYDFQPVQPLEESPEQTIDFQL